MPPTAAIATFGIILFVAGALCLAFGLTLLVEATRKNSGGVPRPFRYWITLIPLGIVITVVGVTLILSQQNQNTYQRLEVEDVVTNRSGEVYIITPRYDALRCSVAAQCAALKRGDTAIYRPVPSSRTDIQDVHKG